MARIEASGVAQLVIGSRGHARFAGVQKAGSTYFFIEDLSDNASSSIVFDSKDGKIKVYGVTDRKRPAITVGVSDSLATKIEREIKNNYKVYMLKNDELVRVD